VIHDLGRGKASSKWTVLSCFREIKPKLLYIARGDGV
jgi:hypothetical protein